jgi:hypothetical protein
LFRLPSWATSTKGGGGSCLVCNSYSYAPFPGSRCLICPPGTQGSVDRTTCEVCPIGTYRSSQSTCVSCTSSSIAPVPGASICQSCPAGTIANAARTICQPCTCQTCGTGPFGCTNPAALNFNLYALRDNGGCNYADSDFVSDIVSCPNEAFTR